MLIELDNENGEYFAFPIEENSAMYRGVLADRTAFILIADH
jgi:hypothetical protein